MRAINSQNKRKARQTAIVGAIAFGIGAGAH